MSAAEGYETWIETEEIGPHRVLRIALVSLLVANALIWPVALVLLAVAVTR